MRKNFVSYALASIICILACVVFNNKKQISPVFLVPYMSGAVNYQFPNNWFFIENEVITYKRLTAEEKANYDFLKDAEQATMYNNNYIGLVYIVMIANLLLPWLGDVTALEVLQVMAHIIISLLILHRLKQASSKLLFFFLYMINPLVIYVATYPSYYFWQILASAVLIPYLLKIKFRYNNLIFVITPVLALAFLTRPAIILCIALFFVFYFFLESKWRSISCFVLLVLLINIFAAKKTGNTQLYWHTIFIGVGAYPNPVLETLSDSEGFVFFYNKTGKIITNTIPGGNMYTDHELRDSYIKTLQNEYMALLRDQPWLLIKNAVLNFFQSFSLGYFVDYPLWVSYISAALGFAFCLLLLLKKQFLWLIAIAASSATFTPYYPPIQVYMYGSFILIVCAFISLLKQYPIFEEAEKKFNLTAGRLVKK